MYGSIFEPGSPYGESEWRRSRGALWDIGPHALSILEAADVFLQRPLEHRAQPVG